jgi:two-component system NtrC family sensor kinase
VLLNLIINAQQSLQDPWTAAHTCDQRFRHACATGSRHRCRQRPGIPAHLRARIFEPYFTTKPTGIGLGVGLAVSLGIVEAHEGTLTVACAAHGGAEFSITLPLGAVDASAVESSFPSKADPSRRTILVIDARRRFARRLPTAWLPRSTAW